MDFWEILKSFWLLAVLIILFGKGLSALSRVWMIDYTAKKFDYILSKYFERIDDET